MNGPPKQAPQHLDTLALLRACLQEPATVSSVDSIITTEAVFDQPECRAFWLGLRHVYYDGGGPQNVSPVTVARAVRDLNLLAPFGGDESGVVDLYFTIEGWPATLPPGAAKDVAKDLQNFYVKGQLHQMLLASAARALRPGVHPDLEIATLQEALTALQMGVRTGTEKEWTTAGEAMLTRLAQADQVRASGGAIQDLRTGFSRLDAVVRGLAKHRLLFLGGWYKGGKTLFAGQVAAHVALVEDETVAFFQQEMEPEMMMDRWFSQAFGVPAGALGWGQADMVDGLRYETWSRELKNYKDPKCRLSVKHLERVDNLYFARGIHSAQQVEAKIRRLNNHLSAQGKKPVRLVIIDYIQMMDTPGFYGDQQEAAMRDLGQQLIKIKTELPITLLGLSQVNKEGDTRGASALIGQADAFWRLTKNDQDLPELDLAYNRYAACGVRIPLQFNPTRLLFTELDRDHEPAPEPGGNGGGGARGGGGKPAPRSGLSQGSAAALQLRPEAQAELDQKQGGLPIDPTDQRRFERLPLKQTRPTLERLADPKQTAAPDPFADELPQPPPPVEPGGMQYESIENY